MLAIITCLNQVVFGLAPLVATQVRVSQVFAFDMKINACFGEQA